MPHDTTSSAQPGQKPGTGKERVENEDDFYEVGPDGKKRLPFWAIVSRELDDLGLTKAEFRIFCHICRRAGRTGVCNDKIRTLARITRTDPRWARWVIANLRRRKLIIRTRRHGDTNILEPAPKYEWLAKYGADADQANYPYEETKDDISDLKLWDRIWRIMPGAPKAPFQAQMKKDRWLFERVLSEVEDRVKRGNRVGPDKLDPVKNVRGLWNYTWAQFEKSNPPADRGTV